MTIQCRTGCGKQIYYEPHQFPDGFVYFLPLDTDEKTIHNCSSLPENHFEANAQGDGWSESDKIISEEIGDDFWKMQKKYQNNYEMEYNYLEMLLDVNEYELSNPSLTLDEKKVIVKAVTKKSLLYLQMRCILFPTPFMYNYIDDPEINPKNKYYYDLVYLSYTYETIGDYQSAITARLIQNKITNDQAEEILRLYNKEKEIPLEKQEEILELDITILELRNKYFRKVENDLKSFIRKQYLRIDEFKKDFSELFFSANQKREKDSKKLDREYDDIFEFLTFGQCTLIINQNKKNIKKKETVWNKIDYEIKSQIYYIVDRRNDIDHYSGDNLEKAFSKDAKILSYVYSSNLIKFFEKLNYV
jgi:hypothetical protein